MMSKGLSVLFETIRVGIAAMVLLWFGQLISKLGGAGFMIAVQLIAAGGAIYGILWLSNWALIRRNGQGSDPSGGAF